MANAPQSIYGLSPLCQVQESGEYGSRHYKNTLHLDQWQWLGLPLGDWLIDRELWGWFYEPSVPCLWHVSLGEGNSLIYIPGDHVWPLFVHVKSNHSNPSPSITMMSNSLSMGQFLGLNG